MSDSCVARWGEYDDTQTATIYPTRIPCVGEWIYVPIGEDESGYDGFYACVTQVRWYGKGYDDRPAHMKAWVYLNGAEKYEQTCMPDGKGGRFL